MLHSLLVLSVVLGLTQPQPGAAAPGAGTTAPVAAPQDQPRKGLDTGLTRRTWTVDGVERMALIHLPPAAPAAHGENPAAASLAPIVFAFHGHGGSAKNASNSFRMHELWPEAIVVYMEGLPTPGALTDPDGKKNGWQSREGLQGDRDLKFFDAVLASLKKDYKVDERRIYAMGHSNGGGFTYLLWTTRPEVFAAFAPSGAFTLRAGSLKPKPVMHIAGKSDPLVKFPIQERTMEAVRRVDGCDEKGVPWATDCTMYASKTGTPVVTMFYDGGHTYPAAAPALIVKFFKEQALPEAGKSDSPAKHD